MKPYNITTRTAQLKLSLLLSLLIYSCFSYTSPSSCTSNSQYYNILTLQCTNCPTNTEKAIDITFCNCTNSFYPNWNVIGFNHPDSCKGLGSSYNKATQVLTLYDQTGTVAPAAVTCSGKAFSKFEENRCQSCGFDSQLIYNSALKSCQCNSGYTKIGQACYQNRITWSRVFSSSEPFTYLAEQNVQLDDNKVKIGCEQQNLVKSCNMLINMCVRAEYSTNNFFCSLLSNLATASKTSLPTYKFSTKLTDSIGIYASSKIGINTTTVKNQLNIISVEYDVYGSIKQIAPIDKDLFECDITEEDVIKFASFGLNLFKQCSTKRTFEKESYYDFFVQTSDGKLAQIPVLIQGSYYKRISSARTTGSHSFSLEFISQPPMLVPIMQIASTSSPEIKTVSNSSEQGVGWIVPFAIFNIAVFFIFILVMYRFITYNPSDDPNDPYFLCKGFINIVIKMFYTWSYGLWIWLLGFSLYVFSFYKYQQTIYIIIPDQQTKWKSFYQTFMIIFYVQMVIMVISLWIVIYSLGDVDFFLIDWEKEKDISKFDVNKQKKEVSVWRRVLLVNELYELAIRKNINIYFVTLFALLFLRGLEWINLSYPVPFTNGLAQLSSTSSQLNVMLSYFIITFLYFIIATIQLIIRNLVKIWFPMPAEDFVDLCAMTNISVLIFNQYLHGYYIHGMHPLGQSEGSLQYIQSIFEKQAKSFGKGRGFKSEDADACQSFEVVFPVGIRRNYMLKYKAPLLQKMVPKNYQNQSIFSNPLPNDWEDNDYDQVDQISSSMAQNMKMYLQCVKASLRNVQDRSWWAKFISCPVTQEVIGNLPIFMKDRWNDFTNVFISGHEFLFLFNFINFVNLWFVITKNIYFASLLAIILNEIVFYMPSSFIIKRNLSKNTFIEQKFFN